MTGNYLGIDFGTSNCSAGWLTQAGPVLANLDGDQHYLSSALFVEFARDPDADDDEQAYLNASLTQRLKQGAQVHVGQAAHLAYSQHPERGIFIRSPKSMLGSRLTPAQSQIYTDISTLLLQAIKDRAELQAHRPCDYAVLGRPIHFQGIDGASGDDRAEAMLRDAAKRVGFKDISFAYEPVAAAMNYELQLQTEQRVLVVDIGGGTSDISMVRLGPARRQQQDRQQDLLAHAGRRIGGVDMDIKLAIYSLMPLLGRGSCDKQGRPLPSALFSDAVNIIDIYSQEQFYHAKTAAAIAQLQEQAAEPALIERFLTLYQQHLSYAVVQQAEQAKIALAKASDIEVTLSAWQPALQQRIDAQALDQAIYIELAGIRKLIHQCIADAGTAPDQIYLTGGASAAAGVLRQLQAECPDIPLIVGDRFGSVGKGLCQIAAHRYGV